MPRRAPGRAGPLLVALIVVLLLLLVGCGGDGDEGASDDTAPDPGVTFAEDITIPTDASGEPDPTATTDVDEPEVETLPGEVPDEFPDDFPVPDDAVVEIGSVGRVRGELRLAVDFAIADGDPAAVHEFYRDAVDRPGFAVLLDDDDGRGARYIGQMVFETNAYVGNVLVSGDGGDGVLLTLTATAPD